MNCLKFEIDITAYNFDKDHDIDYFGLVPDIPPL